MNKLALIYEYEGNRQEITARSSNYARSDNVDALGMDFRFDFLVNSLDENFQDSLEVGGLVSFSNNNQLVFSGIITDENVSGVNKRSYTAYDFAYYLNKSEAMKQFNDISVSDAISQLCGEFNIPIGSVAQIPTLVNVIYNGDTLADIIRDLLKKGAAERGEKYRLEVRQNRLHIERYQDLVIQATYLPYDGGREFDVTTLPADYTAAYSLGEMRNKITFVGSGEKHVQVYGEAEDPASIKKYGLLAKVEKVDDKNSAKAQNMAAKELAELNKIRVSRSLKLFGDDQIRAGRLLVFQQPTIDLVGTFLVKNCTHTYTPALHVMALELAVI